MFKWAKNTIKIYRTFNTLVSCSACENGKQDVAIIGGGIASLCAAISLIKRGAKVTIYCEDDALALNASGNKQGAFYPQLSDDNALTVDFTCTLSVTVANYLIGQSNKT